MDPKKAQGKEPQEIVEVWDENFEEQMDKISHLLDKYNYVAMDTEFPGICYQEANLQGYNLIKQNVDNLKLIQVGIALSDENGNSPSPSTWQFNFKFNLQSDPHSRDSISMLKDAGIKFEDFSEYGIDSIRFAEEAIASGLLLNENINWITFHGAFDFAYLLKASTNAHLPSTLDRFKKSLSEYFPRVYDIKILMKEVNELRPGSLSRLATDLDLKRMGTMHQAGSDSELTLRCFFKLKELFFKNEIKESLVNKVFGLNHDQSAPARPIESPQPSTMDSMNPANYSQLLHYIQPHPSAPVMFGGFPQAEYMGQTYYQPMEPPITYSPYGTHPGFLHHAGRQGNPAMMGVLQNNPMGYTTQNNGMHK